MAEKKYITAICLGITILTLLITVLFMFSKNFGLTTPETVNELSNDGSWNIFNAENINLSDLNSVGYYSQNSTLKRKFFII